MSKKRVVLLSLSAVFAMSAVTAVSASAFVAPDYTTVNGSLLPGLLTVLATHLGTSAIKGTLAGVGAEIQCAKLHATGWLENSVAAGKGFGLILPHYLECTVPKPAGQGCLVANDLIHYRAHVLLLFGAGGRGTYVTDLTPGEGNILTQITISNCTNTNLNNTYNLTGLATGVVNNTALEVEFTKTSGSQLVLGGNAAEYIDTLKIEMEGAGGAAGGGIMAEDGL